MITLYQFELSPFCDKVRRVMHYKGVEYRVEEVPVATASLRIKRVNPIGKVPVLEHDGQRLADSTHIARYLEEKFPSPPIYPKDPRDRALAHVLEEWADESLYFYEVRLRFTFRANAKAWTQKLLAKEPGLIKAMAPLAIPRHFKAILVPQGIGRKPEAMVLKELDEHLAATAELLRGRSWLVGEALSIADIAMVSQLHALNGTQEGAEAIARQPAVATWLARVEAATAKPAPGAAGAHAAPTAKSA